MHDQLVFDIQRLYPQIYLACHIDHVRARSTKWNLSSHDSSVLAHLSLHSGMSPRTLAGHLGVVPSTLSAALKRLERLGYLTNIPTPNDRRRRELWLTKRGAEAMQTTSVLDGTRVALLVEQLSPSERKAALRGLTLLAEAARSLRNKR